MPEHTPAPTPARSLYGFFLYLFSKTILWIYCIWAFTPDYYLHYFNIYYYPQKYWSIAIPIQCLVALTVFAFIIYPSSNLILTANIEDAKTVQDPFSNYTCESFDNTSPSGECICSDFSKCKRYKNNTKPKHVKDNTVPQLHDLDIRFVCKKLYYNK